MGLDQVQAPPNRSVARLPTDADVLGDHARAEAGNSAERSTPRFATAFAKPGAFSCVSLRPDARKDESTAHGNTLKTLVKSRISGGNSERAPVAQLDRASVFGTEGWGFESLRAC